MAKELLAEGAIPQVLLRAAEIAKVNRCWLGARRAPFLHIGRSICSSESGRLGLRIHCVSLPMFSDSPNPFVLCGAPLPPPFGNAAAFNVVVDPCFAKVQGQTAACPICPSKLDNCTIHE